MISKSKIVVLLIVVGLFSMFTMGCGSKSSSNKINLNEYVVFTENGYDGYGSVEYEVNYEQIVNDYIKKFEKLEAKHQEKDGSMQYLYQIDEKTYISCGGNTLEESYVYLMRHISPVLERAGESKQTSLSNGDTCDFKWKSDENKIAQAQKLLGVRLVFEDFTHKIEKLQSFKEVDPFEDVELQLWGQNGTGSTSAHANAYVNVTDVISQRFSLNVEVPDNNGALKNGDVLHAKIYIDDTVEMLLKGQGIVFSRLEADIEIHGLNAYGQAGASNGKKATVNLNDYVNINCFYSDYEKKNYVEATLDYERLIREYKTSLSENVAEEDLFGYDRAQSAAKRVFESKDPFLIICTSHDYEDNPQTGEVIEFSWEMNEEAIAALKKLMNVEFTHSDFKYTIEDSAEQ